MSRAKRILTLVVVNTVFASSFSFAEPRIDCDSNAVVKVKTDIQRTQEYIAKTETELNRLSQAGVRYVYRGSKAMLLFTGAVTALGAGLTAKNLSEPKAPVTTSALDLYASTEDVHREFGKTAVGPALVVVGLVSSALSAIVMWISGDEEREIKIEDLQTEVAQFKAKLTSLQQDLAESCPVK